MGGQPLSPFETIILSTLITCMLFIEIIEFHNKNESLLRSLSHKDNGKSVCKYEIWWTIDFFICRFPIRLSLAVYLSCHLEIGIWQFGTVLPDLWVLLFVS